MRSLKTLSIVLLAGLLAAAMLACGTKTSSPRSSEATPPPQAVETPPLSPTITPTSPSPVSTATPPPPAFGFSWQKDGQSKHERYALEGLQHIAREHPAIAKEVLSLPWVADDITELEWRPLYSLRHVSTKDGPLLQRLVAFPWFADGITSKDEDSAVGYILLINLKNASLAQRLVGFPWSADSITQDEMFFLHAIWQMSKHDDSLAQRVVGLPWIADGITREELGTLGQIAGIASDGIPNKEQRLGQILSAAATDTAIPTPTRSPRP